MVAYALLIVKDVPTIYKEIKVSGEVEDWKGVVEEDMDSLHKNSAQELVKLPKGKKAFGCKQKFAKKDDPFSRSQIQGEVGSEILRSVGRN